jgi:hypothetical protein
MKEMHRAVVQRKKQLQSDTPATPAPPKPTAPKGNGKH